MRSSRLVRQKVEAITGAADILMTRGQAEIYDIERELLVRQYRRETGEDWVEPAEQSDEAHANSMEQLWEYRWTDARDGGAINGPYDADTMRQWSDAGYFGEGVEFRRKDGWRLDQGGSLCLKTMSDIPNN